MSCFFFQFMSLGTEVTFQFMSLGTEVTFQFMSLGAEVTFQFMSLGAEVTFQFISLGTEVTFQFMSLGTEVTFVDPHWQACKCTLTLIVNRLTALFPACVNTFEIYSFVHWHWLTNIMDQLLNLLAVATQLVRYMQLKGS